MIELGKRLPHLGLDLDSLREEMVAFQVVARSELPMDQPVDRFWALVGKDDRFTNLGKLMMALLCIPHSNASSERAFSMVRKIVTENRTRMDNSTLCSLLSCKINFTAPAHTYVPSTSVLQAAKHCTYNYNKSL